PDERAEVLRHDCVRSFEAEWQRTGSTVQSILRKKVASLPRPRDWDHIRPPDTWARLWVDQLGSYFEATAVVLRAETAIDRLRALCSSDDDWSVRHVPSYQGGDPPVPAKCTILGTYEQMGPADLRQAKKVWDAFAEGVQIRGTRVRPGEQLC